MDIERTAERFYERYTHPLSERGESVERTAMELPEPFLWGVTARAPYAPAQSFVLAAYDFPGEMLMRHASIEPARAIVARADAIVLAINPIGLPALAALPGAQRAPQTWERAERILEEVLASRELGRACRVPVAVVLTHADLWLAAAEDCASNRAFSEAYLRELMRRWGGEGLLTRLGAFARWRAFATGLYRGDIVAPLDGADAPLMYLMRRFGLRVAL